jgi:universal stress protein A
MTRKPATVRRPGTTGTTPGGKSSSSRREGTIKTILVPIDFSPASLYPIQWAKFIAQRTGARIHLVSVHDFGYPVATAFTPPFIGPEAELSGEMHTHLEELAAREKLRDAAIHIRAGRPFDQICQLASEIKADLIVVSTHGRTGWERALLGSTAEKITRHAPCPVLVARARRSPPKTKIALGKIVVPVDFSDCSKKGLRYAIGLAQISGRS